MAIKLVLCDDDRLITDSLKFIFDLDNRFEVLRIFNCATDAVSFCLEESVDVILLDIRMPILNGVEVTKQIVSQTETKVLILTTFDEDDYISSCFTNGAKGYLLKNNPPEMIMDAVVSVYNGNNVVQDQVMLKMNNHSTDKTSKLDCLTKRESEIVLKIAEGMTNKEISKSLFISEGTVKNNITSILSKLALKHRTQIAIYYLS